jgi:putative hydrolase of the HAD superfamily
MRFKALMVDVDGVLLVHPDPKGWSVNVEQDLGVSREALQTEFFQQHWYDISHGRADLLSRLVPTLDRIANGVSADTFIKYWFEQDAHVDEDLLGQLSELRGRGLRLHLATVQEHHRAKFIWHELGFEHHFDAIHYAADLGYAKPDLGFFTAIEERTGLQPHELFFIDDAPRNVQAAKERGWSAAVWDRRKRLANLLEEHGWRSRDA